MASRTALASRHKKEEEAPDVQEQPVEPVPAEDVPNDPETDPEPLDPETNPVPEEPVDPETVPPDSDPDTEEEVPLPEEPEIPLQEVPEEELEEQRKAREWAEKHAPEPQDEPLIVPAGRDARRDVREALKAGSQTEEVEPQEDFEEVESIPPIQQKGRKYDAAVDAAISSAASGRSGVVCLRSTADKSVGAAAQTINKTYTTPRTGRTPDGHGNIRSYDISAVGRVDPVTSLVHVYVAAVEHLSDSKHPEDSAV